MATVSVGIRTSSRVAGIATTRIGDVPLTLIVLPKPWRSGRPGHHRLSWAARGPSIVLHERDRLTLDGVPSELLPAFDELFRACERSGVPTAETEGRALLLRQCSPLPDTTPASAPPDHDGVHAVVDLLLLHASTVARRARVASRRAHPLLAPLVHGWFVERVWRDLALLRRGYVPTTEQLGVVRGRVHTAQLGPTLAAGATQLTCTYDRFTRATPVLQLVVSALDVVMRGSWLSRSGLHGAHTLLAVRGRPARSVARALRSTLQDVPSLPTTVARQASADLRLPGHLRKEFGELVDLASDVIGRRGPSWDAPDLRAGPSVWTLSTSDVWEVILARAFRSQQLSLSTREAASVPAAWAVGHSDQLADLWVDDTWLLDAKYSVELRTPPAEHLRQVYAYGRIGVRGAPLPRAVGLVYVSSSGQPTVQHIGRGPLPVQDRIAALSPLPLHLIQAGFPCRLAVRSSGGVEEFCSQLGARLVDALRGAVADAPTLDALL